DHLGAFQVRGRGDHALAAVGAPHRLGHQVVAEAAGVGDRTALAAALGGAHAADVAALAAVPVVGVAGGVGLGLVGEGQQFQQVVLVDVPVQLGAPEPVVGVAVVPAGAGVEGVARIDLLLLVHGEQEQAVVDQRAGGPDVALDQAAAVAAGAVVHRHRVAGAVHVVEAVVLGGGAERLRLEGELHAAAHLVAAGAGDRVDHAAGAAPELDRVAAGLD